MMNLQFAICNFSWLDYWLYSSSNDEPFLLGNASAVCGIFIDGKAERR